jgi:hypothetical protein
MSPTPGPWSVAPEHCTNWWGKHTAGTVVIDANSEPICATNDDRAATEKDFANARLIAAAPDLYDCLAQLVAEGYWNTYPFSQAMYAKAAAAIAKAEGR